MRYKVVLFIVLLSYTGTLSAQSDTTAWDLQRCIAFAVKNNISIKRSDVQARISELQRKQAKYYLIPNLTFSASVGEQFGLSINRVTNIYNNTQAAYNQFTAASNVTLWNYGRVTNNIAATKFSAQAALADLKTQMNSIEVNIATYYFQVLSSQKQLQIAQVQVQQSLDQLQTTREKVAIGNLPELNALELESQLASDSSNLIAATILYQQNILELKAVLNIDFALPFNVRMDVATIPIPTLSELSPDEVYAIATLNMPEQHASILKVKSAEKQVAINKAGLLPTLSFGASMQSNFYNSLANGWSQAWQVWNTQIRNNFGQGVGFTLSVPLFNNGQNKLNFQQSKLNLQSAKLQQEQTAITLKQNIYTAYTNVVSALQKLNAGKKSLDISQKTYDFSLQRYNVGLLGTLDLIINQNNLMKAKLQNVTNEYDYLFKLKLLEFYKAGTIVL